ncbi:MAG: ABC transporter permease [Cyclobacteriaceae bacterium]
MIKNYITIALRNLSKQRFYTLLNVLGLSIGITCFVLITLYVVDELSYDRFHHHADRTYRVILKGRVSGQEIDVAVTCPPMAQGMINEYPEVADATRLYKLQSEVTRYEDIVYTETEVFFADSNFFDVFNYELIAGDPASALKEPNTLVLTEETAKKYFGNESALGKMVTVGDLNATYEVTGIVKDPPHNAHFHFDVLYSMNSFPFSKQETWLSNSFYTYLVLNEGADPQTLEAKFKDLVVKYVGPEVQQYMGVSIEEMEKQGGAYGYFLQPLTDIHLYSQLDAEIEANGNITYVYILSAIALFVIVIACINFMNLATARSANRAKEVGVRKTLGSIRSHLITQFLTESVIVSTFSTLIAVVMIALFIDPFNQISGKNIAFNIFEQPWLLGVFVAILVIVGLLAGSYPAFYLSAFRPAEVLKGKIRAGFKSSGIRNGLVVFQFFISIALIVCTLLVYKQLDFTRNLNLGFDKENVLIIKNGRRLGEKAQSFRQELANQSIVKSAAVSSALPPNIGNNTVFRQKGSEEDHLITYFHGDYDLIPTLGIQIVEGRNFSRDFPSDTAAIILNEAAVREFGMEDPLGAEVRHFGSETEQTMKVVGVMKNFNFQSLKVDIRPVAMILSQEGGYLSVRMQPGDVTGHIAGIESKWKEFSPAEPFEYSFMDDDFDALFRAEQRLGKVFTTFTSFAIFIACLGLLGLAAYTAEQRTKEIGVRKVMGASVVSVMLLLSKDFSKLVLIAFLIAVPVSYWVMEQWLSGFAFRISIGAGAFLLAGILAFIVALITVSIQSLKAARTDPARSLRSE